MWCFLFRGDIILTEEDIIHITLEGKQSAKAEMLVERLYEDNNYLYELAHHFQDEQRYTVALLHDILNRISKEQLATMGFRESYINSLSILKKEEELEEYIDKLIEKKDTVAMDIAIKLLEKENNNIERLKEERCKL